MSDQVWLRVVIGNSSYVALNEWLLQWLNVDLAAIKHFNTDRLKVAPGADVAADVNLFTQAQQCDDIANALLPVVVEYADVNAVEQFEVLPVGHEVPKCNKLFSKNCFSGVLDLVCILAVAVGKGAINPNIIFCVRSQLFYCIQVVVAYRGRVAQQDIDFSVWLELPVLIPEYIGGVHEAFLPPSLRTVPALSQFKIPFDLGYQVAQARNHKASQPFVFSPAPVFYWAVVNVQIAAPHGPVAFLEHPWLNGQNV